ncbi:bZIP transcription factor [Brevibacillus brevis]|uniref:bZIP transcription factor n=1 Tax=Brevibacillus brevis TaxID=1393 RepID=UPI00117842BC|nr:bZIP transcription factor [Brevibacillus brevis]
MNGDIGFTWDWGSFLWLIIFVWLPVGVITYLAIRARFKKKMSELEKRIEKLEQEGSTK